MLLHEQVSILECDEIGILFGGLEGGQRQNFRVEQTANGTDQSLICILDKE